MGLREMKESKSGRVMGWELGEFTSGRVGVGK